MMTVVFGVIGFTVTIIALVVVLLVAKSRLVPSGDVKIVINDDPENTLTTPAGGTLLGTLAENKIFVPSACRFVAGCSDLNVDAIEVGGDVVIAEDVIGEDPSFCEPLDCTAAPSTAGNFAPREGSPVTTQECGFMGALDAQNCGTAIQLMSWGAIKSRYR